MPRPARPFDPSLATSLSRRRFLQLGGLGLSLPGLFQLQAASSAWAASRAADGLASAPPRQPKACILLFAWGGMSHVDTWDLKPDAPDEVRGEFRPITTTAPGVQISEHLPRLAQQAHRLAIVRSVSHQTSDHRAAAYWNLTGHEPRLLNAPAIPPSAEDWPSLGAMVSKVWTARQPAGAAPAVPGNVTLPYPLADRGILYGQFAGFLGAAHEPIILQPGAGQPYKGVSPQSHQLQLTRPPDVDLERLRSRRLLLAEFDRHTAGNSSFREAATGVSRTNEQALNLLLDPRVQAAFDVRQEPQLLRDAYGDHICGQSVLLARRLIEAGVPLVTVNCGAGDLNGGQGDHWDTHGDNFNRLKRDLLPPLDQASAALLDDLAQRGRLDDTLVVWLTEFGRTPQISSGGRNHFPNCYSAAFAGGGIQGGRTYGRSDKTGSTPVEDACGPEDLHATIFHALGIDPNFELRDLQGRPHPLTAGRVLPLF